MAFDSTSPGQPPRRSKAGTPPQAPRPGSELWHALREEGIQWEGQVLVVGSGLDIPALLVLTSERLVLIHEGTLALEAARTWLRPEPTLLSENGIRISVTPVGGAGRADETDRLTVRARDGRGAAARFVSAVSARLVSPREEHRIPPSSYAEGWATTAGAAMPIALPPLPDFGMSTDAETGAPHRQRAWPPVEHEAIPSPAPPVPGAAWERQPDRSPWNDGGGHPSPSEPPTTVRNGSWPAAAVPPGNDEEHHQFNRGLVWGLRSAILAVMIVAGLYFGRDSLPANVDFSLPANVAERLGFADDGDRTDVSQLTGNGDTGSATLAETAEATKADSDGTSGPPNGSQIGPTGDDSVGGQDGEITPVDPGIGAYGEPTTAPEVEDPPADEGADSQTEATVPPVEPTAPPVQPTSPPATEAPVVQAPPTEIPVTIAPETEVRATEAPATEAPVTEAPATEAPATEALVTEAPMTAPPGTATPTDVPGRQDPTESATSEAPAPAPATEGPEATLESQPASVDDGSTPEQALASGAFRYAITGAARGETLAELPEVNAVGGYGEWVVLSMYGQNWSDTEQVFDMSEFKLYADGEEVLVDVGNAWISGLLGHSPAYGNTDAILWAAGEGHPFALTFLAPPNAEQLTLVAGEQVIDLSAALAESQSLAEDANAAPLPDYLEAEVVEVLSAEEIVIAVDGVEQTVRYLGLDVPTGDDCFAAEATAANRDLVVGKTVRLERQATDVDARGRWVRDVWAPAEDGRYFLVSEALVAEGAATVGISEPNTRYEGWLLGSQSVAKAEERGLWGACAGETASAPARLAAVGPAPSRDT